MIEWWQNLPNILSPIAFSIGNFDIRYYSLGYIVAFLIVYFLVQWRVNNEKEFAKMKIEDIQDFMFVLIFSVILGGRFGYVIFYDWAYFLANPMEILIPYDFATKTFTGLRGMSFHGGLIGAILGGWIFTKIKKVKFKNLENLFMPIVPLAYTFGRLGNFLNNELWGRKTDFVMGMYVNNSKFLRHPSQLYEAFFEGIVLFIVLWTFRNHPKFKNNFLSLFLIGYGVVRFFIEFVREPDEHLGLLSLGLSMGQYLCLVMIAVGVGLWLWRKSKLNQ